MSAATLEDSQLPNQAQPTQPGNDQVPARNLDELDAALTLGAPADQQEAGRSIVRFYASQGAALEGPGRLAGRVLGERHAWSARWWRDRLGEVRTELKAGTPTRLTVVPNIDADGTPDPATDTQTRPNQPSAGTPCATTATSEPPGPAAADDGSGGKQPSPVAGPVAESVASVASNPAPPVPPLPPARGDGADGSASPATRATSPDAGANDATTAPAMPAMPAMPADLATAQHTARGSRATTRPAGHEADPHAIDSNIPGSAGLTMAAEPASPSRSSTQTVRTDNAPTTLEPSNDRPTNLTLTHAHRHEPSPGGRSSGTGWPEPKPRADEATTTPNLPSAPPQRPSEAATTPAADHEPSTLDEARQSPAAQTPRDVEPTANPQTYAIGLITGLTAAWIFTTQQTQQIQRALPRAVQPTTHSTDRRQVSERPERDQTDQADQQRETSPETVASPLPPAESPATAPLPRPEPRRVANREPQPATPADAPTLANAATTPTDLLASPANPGTDTLATQTGPAAPATAAGLAGVAGVETAAAPQDARHGTAMAGSAKLQYAFYGVASLFALVGQVWAALDHIPFPSGWPVLLRALVMAPALAVIELGGVATSHQADLRRRLGEQAYGYRALSFMAAAVAAGVNLLGHWGQWFPAVGFTGLSIFAYTSWLMQSAAQRRDTLRAAGQMARTAPVFGPIQWVVQPKLTWRARTLAISESLGRTESLKLAEEQIRAEMRKRALVAMLRKVMKNQKKDANAARIALATIDYDRLAAALQERTNYDLWTDHFSANLVPPVPSGQPT